MTIKQVLIYPNKALREQSVPVEDFEAEEFKQLIVDLKDTVEAYRAHGLAAPQLGVNKRVFVTNTGSGVKYFVNPVISEEDGSVKNNEGCLSFPGVSELIDRFEEITITAQDETGKEFTCCMDELDAVALQHEFDHLNGVLFIDLVSTLKKRYMLRKLQKVTKHQPKPPPVSAKELRKRLGMSSVNEELQNKILDENIDSLAQ
jgi:peptide deformylase